MSFRWRTSVRPPCCGCLHLGLLHRYRVLTPRLMNAVPSGLSRRFATKLRNGHSFSPLATKRRNQKVAGTCQEEFGETAKRCQAQLLQFRQHFCTLLVSFWLLPVNTWTSYRRDTRAYRSIQSWHWNGEVPPNLMDIAGKC